MEKAFSFIIFINVDILRITALKSRKGGKSF